MGIHLRDIGFMILGGIVTVVAQKFGLPEAMGNLKDKAADKINECQMCKPKAEAATEPTPAAEAEAENFSDPIGE